MKLSLNSLRRMVLQEMKQLERNPRSRNFGTKKREKRLVENALRLLWEGDEEYDGGEFETIEGGALMDIDKPSDGDLDAADEQLRTHKGGLQKQVNTSLQATVAWLNEILTDSKNPKGEKVSRAVHYLLGHGASQGSGGEQVQKKGDLAARKAGAKPKCGTLFPTQGEISLFKSIGHPLANPQAFMNCFSGDPHGKGKCIVAAGNKVLDGHHRWSSAAVIGGSQNFINAVMLQFPSDIDPNKEDPLSASQVAIVGATQYDTLKAGGGADVMVPYATTAGPIDGTDSEASPNGVDDNILGAEGALKAKLLAFYKAGKLDLIKQGKEGSFVNSYKGGTMILNDAYVDYAVFGNQGPFDAVSGFTEKFRSALNVNPPTGAAQGGGENESAEGGQVPDSADTDSGPGAEGSSNASGGAITSLSQCSPEQKLKIIEALCDGLQANWSSCAGSKLTDAPARNLMPQFDGGETHKDKVGDRYNSDKDIIDKHMPAGETNYKETYHESIDIKRWHKLAGILKD